MRRSAGIEELIIVTVQRTLLRLCAVLVTASGLVMPSFAATITKVNDDALGPIRAVGAKKIRIDKLPLYDSKRSVIDLEEFQLWAPDGKVLIHDGKGNVQKIAPPAMRYFRGQVNGDAESFAYFSIESRSGRISGMVATRDDNFAVDGVPRVMSGGPRNRIAGDSAQESFDYFLTSTNASDMNTPETAGWQCQLDQRQMAPPSLRRTQTDAKGAPIQSQALTGTQRYSIRIEIETDDELYANAGNNVSTLTTYVTNLTGAVATIYNRDLKTDVIIAGIHTHTGGPGTDQWANASDTSPALYELGTYYHNNPGYSAGPHSSVVALSGKNLGGGIAWEGVICRTDFFCGATGANCGDPAAANQYGGAYAWCGMIGNGGFGSITNPDATTNGALYGMASGTQNYWPLSEYAHELGHTLAGHHTHCVAITDLERSASVFTDGSAASSASNFVDHCFTAEGAGCYGGTPNYTAGSQTINRGTIMSYCHNVFNAGVPQSRFTFGQAAEPSHHELDDYMLKANPLSGGTSVVGATVAAMSSFTAPASVTAGATGIAASIAATNATRFEWTITNGTITSGATSNNITFTAGASGTVTLKATAYGANNCGVTDMRTVAINSISFNPPTAVSATAISEMTVTLAWIAPAAGSVPGRYNIYRSANNTVFANVGNTAGVTFDDTTASPNTSYIYKVRSASADGVTESADSNRDLTTTTFFTDGTLNPSISVRAVHISELRIAVNAVRTLAGLSAYVAPSVTSGVTAILRTDITDLRAALDAARSTLALPAVAYTDPVLTAGVTTIKSAHFSDLRGGVQ